MIKIIQPAQIETAVLDDIMAVKIPKELMTMATENWFFFLDLKQIKKKSLDLEALRTSKDLRRYFYFEDDIHKVYLLQVNKDSGYRFFEELEKYNRKNSLEILKQNTFDPAKLMWLWNSDNLFFRFREDMPITRPYFKGYIGYGVCNDYYDLDKAEQILNKHKWVSKVDRMEIPYYNVCDDCQEAVEFVVRLPQCEFDKLVRYYRDEKKEKYWSVRLKDDLTSPYSPFDTLGLKAALKTKPSSGSAESRST